MNCNIALSFSGERGIGKGKKGKLSALHALLVLHDYDDHHHDHHQRIIRLSISKYNNRRGAI